MYDCWGFWLSAEMKAYDMAPVAWLAMFVSAL